MPKDLNQPNLSPDNFSNPQKFASTQQHLWMPVVLTFAVGIILFWGLGDRSLSDWDEAIYAQISKEVIKSGQWLTLHWGYQNWFHKPPLFMWLTSLTYYFFGISESSARAVSAAAGTGLALLTYLIATKLYDRAAGFLAVIVLLTSYAFTFFSRFGTTDITLTFCIYVAFYLYSQAIADKKWAWYWVWLAISLAVLVKGIAAFVLPISIVIALFVKRRFWQTLKLKQFWLGFLLASLIVLPWHIFMIVSHGQEFINNYLLYHVLERATNSIEGHEGGAFFYLNIIQTQFFPWFLLLPVALWGLGKKLRQDASGLAQILLVLVSVVLLGYSLASTKLAWYIIPIYPSLAIWVGGLLSQVFKVIRPIGFWGLVIASLAASIMFPSKIAFLSPFMQNMAVVFLSSTVVIGLAVQMRWKSTYKIISLGLTLLLITAGLREVRGLYYGHGFRPEAKLAQIASQPYSPENSPIVVVKIAEPIYVPAILFYSNRPVSWVREIDELNKLELSKDQDIILAKADIGILPNQYSIDIFEEAGEFAYGKIYHQN